MIEELITRVKAKGPEKVFLEWIGYQPSAYDGDFDWDWDTGTGHCQACHYRTADNAGIATKPAYWAIPLTSKQHHRQHQIGQFAFMPREWWEAQVINYLHLWLES